MNAVRNWMQTICLNAHYCRLSAERKTHNDENQHFRHDNTNLWLLRREFDSRYEKKMIHTIIHNKRFIINYVLFFIIYFLSD